MHKFSKRLHGLLGRWAPSFSGQGVLKQCACVWNAEDAGEGFGWVPVTKVNIWAKSLLESDLVYRRDSLRVCVCVYACVLKWACLLPLVSLSLIQMKIAFCTYWICHVAQVRPFSDTANRLPFTYQLSEAKQACNDSVLIYTAATLKKKIWITVLLLL